MKLVAALVSGQLVPSAIAPVSSKHHSTLVKYKYESSGSCVSGTSSGWRKHKYNPAESNIQASRATTPFREVALESFASLPDKSGSTLDYRHLSSCTYVLCALKGICCGLSVLPIRRYPKPGGVVASHPTPGNMFTDAYGINFRLHSLHLQVMLP